MDADAAACHAADVLADKGQADELDALALAVAVAHADEAKVRLNGFGGERGRHQVSWKRRGELRRWGRVNECKCARGKRAVQCPCTVTVTPVWATATRTLQSESSRKGAERNDARNAPVENHCDRSESAACTRPQAHRAAEWRA